MSENPAQNTSSSSDTSSSGQRAWWQLLGPGLLYAGAAVGVSHLVQSTRAGAKFGALMIVAVLIANVAKYPFFEFGPRYTGITGRTLLDGYLKIGRWALWLFAAMTLATVFLVQAAITVVTAGLAEKLLGWGWSPQAWCMLLLGLCMAVLALGNYRVLDRLMKVIIITLSVTTVVAFISAFFGTVAPSAEHMESFSFGNSLHLAFLIALLGWMPAPIDIAVWHSVWCVASNKQAGRRASLRDLLLDFKIGYWGTTLLAVCFVALGALVMYGTGEAPSGKGPVFAGQVIRLYTASLGDWAWLIIALAAFTTMFSTTLTVLDAYPRVLSKTSHLLFPKLQKKKESRTSYWFWLSFTAIGTLIIVFCFLSNMTAMVDLATSISFLIAPVLALMNYKAVTSKDIPKEQQPGIGLRIWTWIGMAVLLGLGGYYLFIRFSPSLG